MEFVVTVILLCIAAYCVGALPIGYFIARACGIGNIYEHGSGTMGATNVARVLGIPYFFLVLFFDVLKAYYMLRIAHNYECGLLSLFCIAASLLIGNSFSIFVGGHGGKGVATLFGILLAYAPAVAGLFMLLWFLLVVWVQRPGFASVGSLVLLPFICWIVGYNGLFFVPLALFVLFRHRSHLVILLR